LVAGREEVVADEAEERQREPAGEGRQADRDHEPAARQRAPEQPGVAVLEPGEAAVPGPAQAGDRPAAGALVAAVERAGGQSRGVRVKETKSEARVATVITTANGPTNWRGIPVVRTASGR